MVALLGPVAAPSRELSLARVNAELRELVSSVSRNLVPCCCPDRLAARRDEHLASEQRISEGNAETSGEVVIAATCIADGMSARSLPERTDRL
jgi:hypothetical protein